MEGQEMDKYQEILGVSRKCFFGVVLTCMTGIIIGSFFDLYISKEIANVTEIGYYFGSFGCYFSYCLYPAAGMCLYKGLKKKGLTMMGTVFQIIGWFLAVYYTDYYRGDKIRSLFQYKAGESSPWISILVWLMIAALYVWPMIVCSKVLDETDGNKLIAVGAVILIAGILSDNVNCWLKQIASRPRYQYLLTLDDPVSEYRNWWQMIPYLAKEEEYFDSWPSHSVSIATIMFALPMVTDLFKARSKKKNIIAFLFACVFVILFAYNKLHMTKHFLSDVCFGALITYLIFVGLSKTFLQKRNPGIGRGKSETIGKRQNQG